MVALKFQIERIYGLEGMLALKNFKRNKRRYRSIILSLTFSIVLFVCVSTFGNYLNQIEEQSTVDIDGDIIFYTKDMEEGEREVAMLRSVGMSNRDFNKMMCFECGLYGVKTMLWGLPLSVVSCLVIYWVMVIGSIEGSGIAFVLPWGSIGISVLGVFIIIFITMLYAINKIKKENIIDALRDDMA